MGDSESMREQVLGWVKRMRAAGKQVVEYPCPTCHATNYSAVPNREGEVFDTMSSCLACKKIHFRATRYGGGVETTKLD